MIKDLLPRQVVCTERDEKGKPCHGSLKRYFPFAKYFNETDAGLREEIRSELGDSPDLVLLKCDVCSTVYHLPAVLKRKYRQSAG